MKKLLSTLTLLFCTSYFLNASQMKLSIRYLGLPVVRVQITEKNNQLTIKAKATIIASIAAKMNNTYISKYTDNFMPISYRKLIDQSDYREDRLINYDRDSLLARRTSYLEDQLSRNYPINPESRDFFSALFYLRSQLNQESGILWLDANSLIWKAKFRIVEKERISTPFGKRETIKVKIDFENINNLEKERSDMLTNNLVTEEKSLYFWFTADEKHIPVKAKFAMKPFPVMWTLDEYED